MLPETIESVLQQTYKNREIIVVDDGSTDETRAVVERYGDKVKYIYQENSGGLSARNNGVVNSQGKYIAFLDDDDLWHHTMLEKSVHTLIKAGEDIGVAYVAYNYFRDSDKDRFPAKQIKRFSGNIFEVLLQKSFIPINTVLIKKECIEKVGGFDETLIGYEDWDLFLRISFAGYNFTFINEPLAYIRVHDTHRSSNLLMMKRCSLKAVEKLATMPSQTSLQANLIKRTLAKKHLALGWYLMLNNRRDEGKEEMRNAVPMDRAQRLQKGIAIVLSSIPSAVILKIFNTLVESIFGQRSPYRRK